MKKLSVVIPCYNEAATAAELLDRVLAFEALGWEKEIVVVEDCSTDNTREILARYESRVKVIYQEQNGGKGTAVRRGLAEATGEYVLIQDADLEYDPADIPALLKKIDDGVAEVVYGSRNLTPKRRGGLIAKLGVACITIEINTLWGLSLTDVWTCYKLFPREAAGDFVAGRFESELLFTAALARRRYRFVEVPISYNPRTLAEGKKIRYRDGIWALMVIALDWFTHPYAVRRPKPTSEASSNA